VDLELVLEDLLEMLLNSHIQRKEMFVLTKFVFVLQL
jgi:hypothetical protein